VILPGIDLNAVSDELELLPDGIQRGRIPLLSKTNGGNEPLGDVSELFGVKPGVYSEETASGARGEGVCWCWVLEGRRGWWSDGWSRHDFVRTFSM
jgi:hypothetical protein